MQCGVTSYTAALLALDRLWSTVILRWKEQCLDFKLISCWRLCTVAVQHFHQRDSSFTSQQKRDKFIRAIAYTVVSTRLPPHSSANECEQKKWYCKGETAWSDGGIREKVTGSVTLTVWSFLAWTCLVNVVCLWSVLETLLELSQLDGGVKGKVAALSDFID